MCFFLMTAISYKYIIRFVFNILFFFIRTNYGKPKKVPPLVIRPLRPWWSSELFFKCIGFKDSLVVLPLPPPPLGVGPLVDRRNFFYGFPYCFCIHRTWYASHGHSYGPLACICIQTYIFNCRMKLYRKENICFF